MEGRRNHLGGTVTTRVICAVSFIVFSFLWFYWFQADLLAVAQHVLSGGVTHYDRLIGATIITTVLFLLQLAVHAVTRLSRRTHALTYLPSFLALTFLSDVRISNDNSVEVGSRWWLLVIVFILWIGAVWLARQMLPFSDSDKQPTGLFSDRTWMNLVQMTIMMLFVAAIGNTNAVLHFRAHAETALMRGDTREALHAGWESLETDPQLTMLRAYALSREGMLGEKLFCYPVAGRGSDLLPMNQEPLLLPADSIWRHLGGKPAFPMPAGQYYHLLAIDSLATPAVADYVLCGKLIDGDLTAFVRLLPRYYDVSQHPTPSTQHPSPNTQHPAPSTQHPTPSTLPRHYREALILYVHEHPGSGIRFHDEALEQEWQEFQQLKARHSADSERSLQLLENFRNTYWYYFTTISPFIR